MRSLYVDLPAGRFHCRHWSGPGTGRPPLVLLHGVLDSAATWHRVGPELARHAEVFALDQRGHGTSPHPPRGHYGLHRAADDLAALLRELHLTRPVLIGHSWGAAVALALATGGSHNPDASALSGLVLEELPASFASPILRELTAAGEELMRLPDSRRAAIVHGMSPHRTSATTRTTLDGLRHTTPDILHSVMTDSATAGDLLPLLARVTVPLLILRADPAVRTGIDPLAWVRTRRYLPEHGRLTQVSGADHSIHHSRSADYLRALRKFLHTLP
ncbi:alpha/beta hydrolase [Streptomyces sp. NPDC050617]|uniref:alpha/beta fold hydrolase n=1 Tax=Streptomyces sp. NPDC050617 TaxID=3154628 RepID=UPI00344090E5